MLGRIVGREARATGIHVVFAPVVDVHGNLDNPAINVRSFGQDVERVAVLGARFVAGVQAEGVAAVAKHFPGHGDADIDSHRALAVSRADAARLDQVELVPFRTAIAAGVAGVMSAHVAVPAVQGDMTPATLAPAMMRGLLRDALGFRGLAVTDALNMGAVRQGYGVEQSAVLAIAAGNDLLLMPSDVRRCVDGVTHAVRRGALAAEHVEAALRRVLELKVRTGAVSRPIVDLDVQRQVVGAPAHRAAARDVAQRAITLLRDDAGLVPLPNGQTIATVVVAPDAEVTAGRVFRAVIRAARGPGPDRRVQPGATLDLLRGVTAATDSADVIVVLTVGAVVEGEGRLRGRGLGELGRDATAAYRRRQRHPVCATAVPGRHKLSGDVRPQ